MTLDPRDLQALPVSAERLWPRPGGFLCLACVHPEQGACLGRACPCLCRVEVAQRRNWCRNCQHRQHGRWCLARLLSGECACRCRTLAGPFGHLDDPTAPHPDDLGRWVA